jgi:hypothetical protein
LEAKRTTRIGAGLHLGEEVVHEPGFDAAETGRGWLKAGAVAAGNGGELGGVFSG